jgi:hypothetical protein
MDIKEAIELDPSWIFRFMRSESNFFDFDRFESAWQCLVSTIKAAPPNSEITESPATDRQQLKAAIALVREAGDRHIRPDDQFMSYGLLLTTIEKRAAV